MDLVKQYSRHVINPDLANERLTATFNIKELTSLIDDGEENTRLRHTLEKSLQEDPNIPNPFKLLELSSDDYYKSLYSTMLYAEDKIEKQFRDVFITNSQEIRFIYAPSEKPTSLHNALFVPTLLRHLTSEQLSEWMPLLESKKIFGTYAQTELGHGSNIKHLETTATYDVANEEFVLNSPTLTSIKCWAAGLGRTATHAIVMAQLHIKDVCYGIHMFLVQLRDINNHSSLPGITLGEMGPKMGYLGTDNGYLRFNNIRIPRKNMLMKFAQVLKDGTYVKPKFDRANYGMMVFLRTFIVHESAKFLAQTVTIAVRYNAVRRQGKIENKSPEDTKIIDYKTQQYKLLPQVALAYAYFFVFKRLLSIYTNLLQSDAVAEVQVEFHALSAGLKAFSTCTCAEAAEICRKSCGGLGYLEASRLPALCTFLLGSCTYEGDHTILYLQTARFLMKSIKLKNEGKSIGKSVEYLKGPRDNGPSSCMQEYVKLFEKTTTNLVNQVYETMNNEILMGKTPEIAWQEVSVHFIKCAQFHSQVFVMQSLHDFFLTTELSPSLRQVLEKLFQFLAIYWILERSGDFIEYGNVSIDYIKNLRFQQIPQYLKDLRMNIVSLVDAFDFCDATLQSVIGCYDGRAYEHIFEYWSSVGSNKNQIKTKIEEKSKL